MKAAVCARRSAAAECNTMVGVLSHMVPEVME